MLDESSKPFTFFSDQFRNMPGNVIVLLSSDDSDTSVAPCVPKRTVPTGPKDDFPQRTTSTTSIGARPVVISNVADTPVATSAAKRAERLSRFGLSDFSSDDASSPFPTISSRKYVQTKQTPRRALADNSRAQNREGPVVILSDSADETSKNNIFADGSPGCNLADQIPDDYSASHEMRPRKRPRWSFLSDTAASAVRDMSEVADFDIELPRRNPPAKLQRSSLAISGLHAQTTTVIDAAVSEQSLHCPEGSKAPPANSVQFIDLLSSSDSEAGRTASPRDWLNLDEQDLDDLDDLLMTSSPAAKNGTRLQKTTKNRNENEPMNFEKELALEIMSLTSSSPPPVRPTSTSSVQVAIADELRGIDRPAGKAASGVQLTSRRRPYRRSLSEGQGLGFLDDDDEGDSDSTPNFAAIESLLAAWRGNDEVEEDRPIPQPNNNPAARRSKSDLGRRTVAVGDVQSKEDRRKEREADQEQRRREKEAEKEKKQREKEVERERKRIAAQIAKEKKADERAAATAFNEANKARTDKSIAAPEMVIRLPSTLPQATREVLEPMLTEIKVEFEAWTSPTDSMVLTWRRKVTAEYRADLGHWVPVPLRINDEKYAVVILRGEELVKLILAQDPEGRRRIDDLGGHVRTMRRHFPEHTILYVVEGLAAWKSKNMSIRNRQFVEAVRGAGGEGRGEAGDGSGGSRGTKRTGRGRAVAGAAQHVDETVVEDALMALQVEHDVLVHESGQALDTARWIRAFTEQIATGRYRQQKEQEYAAAASFCMDAGQIATGDGGAETYALMLQQIARVTEPVALGVVARFDSVPKLVRGLAAEGPLALEACLKSRNRNGALSDRTIGPALSRRIYKVFMGEDEASTEI
ncbi:alpha-mannosyltransferase [Grosmannia clavigera kw1407]|uniref:Alpha-mannosyltransferase n=1 Tax=Grosmannia clavigera (strain kw1407 / UAMH 11150) TaxID=655863 RepID=F0X7G6_GROCL|nr:alpha-mannosyltransferase [Grosmannia clavigera kw1407]EFX06470.1 alpha-mannosyltransferase [Grosmannia clavigera kw1407]